MASHLSLRLPQLFSHSRSFGLENCTNSWANSLYPLKFSEKGREDYGSRKNNTPLGCIFMQYNTSRGFSSGALSSMTSAFSDQNNSENGAPVAKPHSREMDFNRIHCLVWVLHESARSFSLAVESLEWAGSGPELAMAWIGKDVHEWHKRISYQVAVYALMETAIEVEVLLSQERHDFYPVREILTPQINLVGEYIENQLEMRNSELLEWFREVELPRIVGFFSPLLKQWSMEYAGSGVAGIIVAISCCSAVGKLGYRCISCPLSSFSLEDVLVELMEFSHKLVSADKLHHLATEAGFEQDFLSHFGKKVLPSENIDELEFWIGLAHKKLSAAFYQEIDTLGSKTFHNKVQADSLATLGLFAYLGRRTRLFLSGRGIKDLDELVQDFLSYLECGSLFIYPEFSSISVYQFFMEVVTDEIGWLDFYASFSCISSQERKERKRSKNYAIQAEKEITLSNVFTVCYDAFSGFAHFSRSTQQTVDKNLLSFLLQSQSLLTICLEDYWAAYDRSVERPINIAETGALNSRPSILNKSTMKSSLNWEAQEMSIDLTTLGFPENKIQHESKLRKATSSADMNTTNLSVGIFAAKSDLVRESLLWKYCIKLKLTSYDLWMGTQLLFIDIAVASELLLKQMHGHKVTKREKKKLKRTFNDIASLIPVTILMLLPVSAIGHAAMLAAIKKYTPSLIPSPFSSERLEIVNQLKRTKKVDVRLWSNLEDAPSKSHK